MEFGIILLAGAMAATVYLVGRKTGALARLHALPAQHTSPMDEAERILTYRYAKGEITRDEFARMMAILRR